jgi:hypothetical protein
MTSTGHLLRVLESRAGGPASRRTLTPEERDRRDRETTERASRLAALRQTDVWPDLVETLERAHFQAGRLILTETGEARAEMVGYQKALEDLAGEWAGSIELGRTAMRRLLERRFGPASNRPGASMTG